MRTNILAAAAALSDRDLLARIGAIVGREREATAELVAHLAALEMRPGAYAAQGYGSLFEYCTGALRLSEDAACNRIDAARACARFPVILDLLAAGSLTLTSVRKLKGHHTLENHEAVLGKAANRRKEEVEALIAELAPKPDVPASVRKLPVAGVSVMETGSSAQPSLLDPGPNAAPIAVPTTAASAGPAGQETVDPGRGESLEPALSVRRAPRPVVQALSPQRYRVQFTIGQETHDRLRRVQALLRRQIPDGHPGTIFDRALALLEEVERKKRGFGRQSKGQGRAAGRNYENRIRSGTDRPARSAELNNGQIGCREADTRSRHIPAAVKRAVWWRDGGQCAFMSDAGRRCTARSFLELHHIQPHAMDGPPTAGNISLRCRRHNEYEAELVFGPVKVPTTRARTLGP